MLQLLQMNCYIYITARREKDRISLHVQFMATFVIVIIVPHWTELIRLFLMCIQGVPGLNLSCDPDLIELLMVLPST
jgi:hypothetical protein